MNSDQGPKPPFPPAFQLDVEDMRGQPVSATAWRAAELSKDTWPPALTTGVTLIVIAWFNVNPADVQWQHEECAQFAIGDFTTPDSHEAAMLFHGDTGLSREPNSWFNVINPATEQPVSIPVPHEAYVVKVELPFQLAERESLEDVEVVTLLGVILGQVKGLPRPQALAANQPLGGRTWQHRKDPKP